VAVSGDGHCRGGRVRPGKIYRSGAQGQAERGNRQRQVHGLPYSKTPAVCIYGQVVIARRYVFGHRECQGNWIPCGEAHGRIAEAEGSEGDVDAWEGKRVFVEVQLDLE